MAQALLRDPITAELARAVEAGAGVRALEHVGLTQRALAIATGASERSVRDWRTTSAILPRHDDRLREVQAIVLILGETLTPRGISQWFSARNRLLDGRRPVDALGEGDVVAVRAAAASLVEGAHV